MKVLVATEKPFAKIAVDGIKKETEVQSCTDNSRYHSCKNTVDKL